jgi:hypothetical protein
MFKPLLRSTVPLIKAATRKSTSNQLKTLLVKDYNSDLYIVSCQNEKNVI